MYLRIVVLLVFFATGTRAQEIAATPGQPIAGMFGVPGIMDLLSRDDVHRELELLDDQLKAINEVKERIHNEMQEANRDAFKVRRPGVPVDVVIRESMIDIQRRAVKDIEKTLLPHQMKRLRQIDLQRRVRGASFALFATKEIAEELSFTAEQRVEIPEFTKELTKEMREVYAREQKKALEKVLSKLTEEQQARYREVIGKEFNFEQ